MLFSLRPSASPGYQFKQFDILRTGMRRGIAIQVISVRNLAKQGNFQFCLKCVLSLPTAARLR